MDYGNTRRRANWARPCFYLNDVLFKQKTIKLTTRTINLLSHMRSSMFIIIFIKQGQYKKQVHLNSVTIVLKIWKM